jgi:hypothetical protein
MYLRRKLYPDFRNFPLPREKDLMKHGETREVRIGKEEIGGRRKSRGTNVYGKALKSRKILS